MPAPVLMFVVPFTVRLLIVTLSLPPCMLIFMSIVTLLTATGVLVRPFTVVPLPATVVPVMITWFGIAPAVIVMPLLRLSPLMNRVPA